jgi:AraC-like DNA-binding protein
VIRFERARRMLQSVPPHISIAQVAATCGYYDQSHLTNEFTELAGCTPTQLLAEEGLPSGPERPGDEGAESGTATTGIPSFQDPEVGSGG